MAKKKSRAVAEERAEERAPEPVAEPPSEPEVSSAAVGEPPKPPMPEINPVPYLGFPPENEAMSAPPAMPPLPPALVVERAPPLEEQFRSLNSQRLVSIARSHGVPTEGRSREELVAGIVAAVKAQEVSVSAAPATGETLKAEVSAAAVVAPSHSFLLGPGEKPLAISGAPPPAPEKPNAEAPKPRAEVPPAAKKSYSSL